MVQKRAMFGSKYFHAPAFENKVLLLLKVLIHGLLVSLTFLSSVFTPIGVQLFCTRFGLGVSAGFGAQN